MSIYIASVTREYGVWLADVPALPGAHTSARSLAGLHRAVREVITLMDDLPDEAVSDEAAFVVDWQFELSGELGEEVREAWQLRRELRALEDAARIATARAARDLHDQGVSLRDSAEILDVSFQRIQQLVS